MKAGVPNPQSEAHWELGCVNKAQATGVYSKPFPLSLTSPQLPVCGAGKIENCCTKDVS